MMPLPTAPVDADSQVAPSSGAVQSDRETVAVVSLEPEIELPKDSRSAWETIDRLDWQLWALAILIILMLGSGVLSFMYPAIFWSAGPLALKAPERAFYGLCVLLGLTLTYLLEKQAKLRKAKHAFVAERSQWEQGLVHNAYHDALTNLPNRALFLERLKPSLSRAKRKKDYQFAVIFIDLDRFKLINDSLGHRIGDQVLIEVARRIQRCLRGEDTVARLGGDEFAILLQDINEMGHLLHVMDRIREELASPIIVNDREIFTSASMGIALSSSGYEKPEDLLRDSDTAMYRAKAQGMGQHAVFDFSMHEHAVKVLRLESELRRAIERQELVIHYQPIVFLRTGQVAGLEALVRWKRPDLALLAPSEFLPIAEVAGLMPLITRTVLEQVSRQLNAWHTEYPASWPLHVSVNLPAKFLTKEDHVQEIVSLMSRHASRPQSVRLEITENQLMENADCIKNALLQLSNSGARVYIDDFGTGFSSLSYLSAFHVDALKIDQSFVRNLDSNDKNTAIVRSIVTLGQNLGIDVIAEGIETPEQLAYLQAVKCQYGQGYYLARPMDVETVGASLPLWFPESRDKRRLVHWLPTFDLFANLNPEQLLEIAQACEEIEVPSGTVIVQEGQVGDFAYLLHHGSVGVYKGVLDSSDFFAVLEAPSVFGEMALVNSEGVRAASVKALSDLRLLRLPIVPCLSFLRRFPVLKRNLLQIIAERAEYSRQHAAVA